jgi:hypothetical protein
VDLHGMLVEEALAELEQHIECLGGIAYRAPEGIALSVITGPQPATFTTDMIAPHTVLE